MVVKIEGLDKIHDELQKLSDKEAKKAAGKAVRAGLAPIRKQAKINAKTLDDPRSSEAIYKNITIRSMKSSRTGPGTRGARLGVLGGARAPATAVGEIAGSGKGNPGGDTYYWRFLEFGTQKMAAKPFMRPAMESGKNEAFQAAAAKLEKELFK